jgi:hypothetical protein
MRHPRPFPGFGSRPSSSSVTRVPRGCRAGRRAVRHRDGARHRPRHLGRRRPGRDGDLTEYQHRHHGDDRHRRTGQLSVLQRPHRHLHGARRAAGILDRRNRRRVGHGQRPAPRRPDAPGRQHRRDGHRGGRRTAARDRVERTGTGHRPGADRQPAAERTGLCRPGPAQPGRAPVGHRGSRDASFNVNGLRSAVNSFILDGVDNNSYGTSNQGFSNQVVQVSPDAVEEFKVQTNNFSAEFGRTGGAVINASMRSGTNQFRGTAWEFNRNDALNAVGFFKPTSGVKPQLNRNQFGFVFGGPVVRNRTFFFTNYEGFRQVSRVMTFASVPTAAQRQGNLGRPILNPLTGELYADGVVPQSAMTPFARQVLAGLPAPTRPRHRQQLRLAAAARGLQRQVRHQGRSPLQHADERLRALEPPQGRQLRAAGDSRRNRQPEQCLRARAQSAVRRRRHLHAHPHLTPRNADRRVPHRGGQVPSGRRRPDDVRPVRHSRAADRSAVRGRDDGAAGLGLDLLGAAEQQSAVPGSVRHQSAHQLLVDPGAASRSRPDTSTRQSTPGSTTSTRSTGATPTAGSSAVRRAPRPIPPSTTWRTSCSARGAATG